MKHSKQISYILQLLLFGLILFMIWGKLGKAWEQITSEEFAWNPSWGWLTAGAVVYGLSLPFPAMYWFRALRDLGQKPGFYRTIRAHILGHLGKYIPGKIFVVLIRSGALRGPGVDTTVCVLSIFLEGLMQMAVGAFVFAAVLMGWSIQTSQTHLVPWTCLLFAAVTVPILPPVFKFGVRLIGVKKFSSEVEKVELLRWKTFLYGIPLMLGYWTLLGLSFWCTVRGIGIAIPASAYPICLAAIAGSMVAGFVMVVAPGGLGVREALIVLLTAGMFVGFTDMPEAVALVSASVLRLSWIVVELVLAGVLYFIKR